MLAALNDLMSKLYGFDECFVSSKKTGLCPIGTKSTKLGLKVNNASQ